ncbi:MAG: hypothetical protein JST59_00415 [Actinobacteria bacterium]|nr:hypothetical protein [Actinomycetota bacterium]
MGDFWKPTAEMYTSLIERPKMAEKLLIKPPFKYIYDIFAETTKVTNFAKGNSLEIQACTPATSSLRSTTKPRRGRWPISRR